MSESYDGYPRIEEGFQRRLDESLSPRAPQALFDLVPTVSGPGRRAVDVGCGEGGDALKIAGHFGFEVLGVDPVQRHVDLGRAAARGAGLEHRVHFRVGTAEALPVEDRSMSLIWCKEALMFTDLRRAVAEFRRVLCADGLGVIYQAFTGPRMNDAEAREFWGSPGATGASSMRAADLEQALADVGLIVRNRIDYGSEWGEFSEEHAGTAGRRLLHAARLLRQPDRYIEDFGRSNYEIMLTDSLWHVYRMIGKLHGAALVFSL